MSEEKKVEELPKKPKRVLSEKQKEALKKGREKAHERLREFRNKKGSIEKQKSPPKEQPKETEPAPKSKITKKDVSYGDEEQKDIFVKAHNSIVEKEEEEEEEEEEEVKPKIVKKKKKKKQVVIIEESSDSSSSDEEQVIVRRSRRPKTTPQNPKPIELPQVKKPTIIFY